MSRTECENYDVVLPGGGDSLHFFTISVGREGGIPVDVEFIQRGKTGHALDLMFNELGRTLSKILRGIDLSDDSD